MHSLYAKAKLVLIGVFAVSCVAIFTYHATVVWPKAKCEKGGRWWAAEWRSCATPVEISALTGRAAPGTAAPKAP